MHRAHVLAAVAAATTAGCPPPAPQAPLPPPQVGCPAAKDVYTASYVINEAGHGRTGWVLPLFDQKLDSVAGKPEYQQVDPAAARSLGMPPLPSHIWLLQPNAPACEAKIGGIYAAAIDAKGSPNVSYGVELDGCGPPPDGQEGEAIGLDVAQNPGQCHVAVTHVVAERVGDMITQTQWKAPDKETPIPAGLAAAIPKHECVSPGCETLWTVLQIDVDSIPAAWAAAVNWLQVGDPAQACTWHDDTFNAFFIPDAEGKATKVTDGQDHPLALAAVLADSTGPKVLFADGAGEFTAYDLGRGTATVGHHVVWLMADAADYVIDDRLGPRCEEGSGSGGGSGAGMGGMPPR